MREKHLDIEKISAYFMNKLDFEEETEVQEHLRQCPSCRKMLEGMRALNDAFYTESDDVPVSAFKKFIGSAWTKAAASIIIIFGAGFLIYESIVTRKGSTEQYLINPGMDNIENQVFAIDSFDKEDSLYYYDKYGEDFGK